MNGQRPCCRSENKQEKVLRNENSLGKLVGVDGVFAGVENPQ